MTRTDAAARIAQQGADVLADRQLKSLTDYAVAARAEADEMAAKYPDANKAVEWSRGRAHGFECALLIMGGRMPARAETVTP